MRVRRGCAVLLIAASLGVAGCSAGDSSSSEKSSGAAAKDQMADPRGSRPEAGGDGAKQGASGAAARAPLPAAHVIRTAELEVEVKNSRRAVADARRVTEDAGGHVANEATERVDDVQLSSRLVLRVPQERYETVLSELAGSGKLLLRKAGAKDVTDQVVDVGSRIATQRASVERVRELMDRAEKLSDVVTLEGQLSSRQAELESLLARQASLKDRTTLATITLTLSEAPKPVKDDGDGTPTFGEALGGGWDALVGTVRWIGIVIGAVVPFALVLGVLYGLWRALGRPLRARRTADAPRPAGGAAEGKEPGEG